MNQVNRGKDPQKDALSGKKVKCFSLDLSVVAVRK